MSIRQGTCFWNPVVVPHTQLSAALRYLERHGGSLGGPLQGKDLEAEQAHEPSCDTSELTSLVKLLIDKNASDLLLSTGIPPCLKLNNEIVRRGGSPTKSWKIPPV